MTILIPMAGLSRRFFEAGFEKPKYMLPLHGDTLFGWSLRSFQRYFSDEHFVFVFRDVSGTGDFIRSEVDRLGILSYDLVKLAGPTSGQAETVSLGLERATVARDEPLTVFNIDTFRPGFQFADVDSLANADGYLEVFRGSGSNWSFARTDGPNSDLVVETAEKRPISDLCSTGLYYFRTPGMFDDAYSRYEGDEMPERYVAPIYNAMIKIGRDVRVCLIERNSVIFCGVPDEYKALQQLPIATLTEAYAP